MEGINLQYWQFLLLIILAAWSIFERFLIPSVRWFLRRRLNRLIERINETLDIEIRPFQLTKRQVLIDRLVYDPQIMQAIQEQAHEKNIPVTLLQKKVERYANEIVPAFNAYIYYRLGYWIAKRLAHWLYDVRVGIQHPLQLQAVDTHNTVVFVMNHRSNMDYILVSLLASNRTALSYAVGEWARVWPLQALIKAMGAFFVRRNSKNRLYRHVLERYITMATQEGVCQAIFPEGGLSKDGKLRPPKLGLLDYMLRNFDHRKDRDILFIPIGINYDRTLEDRTLLRGLDPNAEVRSKWFALKTTLRFVGHNLSLMWKHRWKTFGSAAVNFGSPISAADFAKAHDIVFSNLDKEIRSDYLTEFSDSLFNAVGEIIPVTPMALICYLLVNDKTPFFTRLELKSKALTILDKTRQKGTPEVIKPGQLDASFDEAIDMLLARRLLKENEGLLTPEDNEKELIQYYANSIAHFL